jgi:hypothetical protein
MFYQIKLKIEKLFFDRTKKVFILVWKCDDEDPGKKLLGFLNDR